MKPPFISKPLQATRRNQRGVTLVLVALTMVAIMAMAALSIDVVTLYLANAEAQRSADAAALAGARILSLTGMTGDPNNASGRWPQVCDFASKVATAVAEQNTIAGTAPSAAQIVVTFPNNSNITTCVGSTTAAFGVNPLVTVKIQRNDLPTFFSRIWGRTGVGVSATATAEAFNSSGSDASGNGGPTGVVTPVQPRCVKPWMVPNSDPNNGSGPFVQNANGAIVTQGVRLNYIGGAGEVGERFSLIPDCNTGGASCTFLSGPPVHNPPISSTGNLEYLPGEVLSSSTAVPACGAANNYQQAIAGCDQTTVYQCGVNHAAAATPNRVDLSENPTNGDTSTAVQCLINQAGGQDTLDVSTYPYRIQIGAGSPLIGSLAAGSVTTSSPSIVSLPIFDSAGITLNPTGTTDVTIVGFLQVFINQDSGGGSVDVTVMNVTGCGNGTNAVGPPVSGTSPVPVRLITYP